MAIGFDCLSWSSSSIFFEVFTLNLLFKAWMDLCIAISHFLSHFYAQVQFCNKKWKGKNHIENRRKKKAEEKTLSDICFHTIRNQRHTLWRVEAMAIAICFDSFHIVRNAFVRHKIEQKRKETTNRMQRIIRQHSLSPLAFFYTERERECIFFLLIFMASLFVHFSRFWSFQRIPHAKYSRSI